MIIEDSKISFLIADDHSIIRQGFSFVINEKCKNAIIFQAKSFSEIEKTLEENKIDVLILDLNFPDGNSINLIPDFKKNYPKIKILVFTAHDEELYAIRCINAGANGYLSKICTEEEMAAAFMSILNNGTYVSSRIKDLIFNSYITGNNINPLQKLTDKEVEVAALYVKGYGNLEICNLLDIKKSTVSTYKSKIFEKLNINNISSLIEVFRLYYKDK